MSDAMLYAQISSLPEHLKAEAGDFVVFPEQKHQIEPQLKERESGGLEKGAFIMAPDFDEPLEEFKDYM